MRDNTQEISIEELNSIFAGRRVQITHTGNPHLKNVTGVCKIFHATKTRGVDIELTNEHRLYRLIPDTVTDNAVEGGLGLTSGRHKVQLA